MAGRGVRGGEAGPANERPGGAGPRFFFSFHPPFAPHAVAVVEGGPDLARPVFDDGRQDAAAAWRWREWDRGGRHGGKRGAGKETRVRVRAAAS